MKMSLRIVNLRHCCVRNLSRRTSIVAVGQNYNNNFLAQRNLHSLDANSRRLADSSPNVIDRTVAFSVAESNALKLGITARDIQDGSTSIDLTTRQAASDGPQNMMNTTLKAVERPTDLSHTLNFAMPSGAPKIPSMESFSPPPPSPDGRPTKEHLEYVRYLLSHCVSSSETSEPLPRDDDVNNLFSLQLPRFFSSIHPYQIYHPEVEFEDNIRNVRTKGLKALIGQFTLLKFAASIKFTSCRMNVLKMTIHPEVSHFFIPKLF